MASSKTMLVIVDDDIFLDGFDDTSLFSIIGIELL